MNITKTVLALAVTLALATSCKESASEPATVAASKDVTTAKTEKLETASFSIEGMTCAVGCAKTIEKKLSEMDGVQKATVDFDKKTATVEFDAAKQSPEKLVDAVESTADGKTYKVSNMKSSGNHAMVIDPEKTKKKKKASKKDAKKAGCDMDAKAGDKPSCCSAKKACHSEKGAM
ncbi:MAG: heavy-metal-associated domain-containing protein [Flavobacterium sp.]|nr:MAG: heavy-metal-associated domain-containing protein [Flavobacterium sp.]